jgi:polyhydroxyalkanoate synthesis regulator phasin
VREAVEKTMQATVGSAGRTRNRAQGTVDDLVDAVRGAIDDRLPATGDDIRELKAELRAIGRRLDALEKKLPASRSGSKRGSK